MVAMFCLLCHETYLLIATYLKYAYSILAYTSRNEEYCPQGVTQCLNCSCLLRICETEPKVLEEKVKPSTTKKGTAHNQL